MTGDIFLNGKVVVDIKKAQYFYTALKGVDASKTRREGGCDGNVSPTKRHLFRGEVDEDREE